MSADLQHAIRDGRIIREGLRRVRTYCDCGGVRSFTPCTADCALKRK